MNGRIALGITMMAATTWWVVELRVCAADLLAAGVDALAALAKTGIEVERRPADVDYSIEADLDSSRVTVVGPASAVGFGAAPGEDDLARAAGASWSDRWRFRWFEGIAPADPTPTLLAHGTHLHGAAMVIPTELRSQPFDFDSGIGALSVRAQNELERAGLCTVGEYADLTSDERSARGISERTERELRAWLEERGGRSV